MPSDTLIIDGDVAIFQMENELTYIIHYTCSYEPLEAKGIIGINNKCRICNKLLSSNTVDRLRKIKNLIRPTWQYLDDF